MYISYQNSRNTDPTNSTLFTSWYVCIPLVLSGFGLLLSKAGIIRKEIIGSLSFSLLLIIYVSNMSKKACHSVPWLYVFLEHQYLLSVKETSPGSNKNHSLPVVTEDILALFLILKGKNSDLIIEYHIKRTWHSTFLSVI